MKTKIINIITAIVITQPCCAHEMKLMIASFIVQNTEKSANVC